MCAYLLSATKPCKNVGEFIKAIWKCVIVFWNVSTQLSTIMSPNESDCLTKAQMLRRLKVIFDMASNDFELSQSQRNNIKHNLM